MATAGGASTPAECRLQHLDHVAIAIEAISHKVQAQPSMKMFSLLPLRVPVLVIVLNDRKIANFR